MSDRTRNFIVGLTFLAALGVCMFGIVLLGKFPSFGGIHQYTVILHTSDANGVSAGSRVEFNGVPAGLVESTWISSDAQNNAVVNVKLKLDPHIDVPSTATASMERPISVGNPYVALRATRFGKSILPKDGTATLEARAGESGLIPKDVLSDVHDLKTSLTTLSDNLTLVAKDLHVLLAYTPPEALDLANPNDPNAPRANASTVIVRLDRTITSLQTLLTDPQLQGQVREAVQNIADASKQLKSTIGKFDDTLSNANGAINAIGGAATQAGVTIQATQKDIDRVAQQLGETLAQLDKSIKSITEGPGTTGKLVNDPRLFDSLLDLSRSLKSTVDDLDFLLGKWKDEGVNLKLK